MVQGLRGQVLNLKSKMQHFSHAVQRPVGKPYENHCDVKCEDSCRDTDNYRHKPIRPTRVRCVSVCFGLRALAAENRIHLVRELRLMPEDVDGVVNFLGEAGGSVAVEDRPA